MKKKLIEILKNKRCCVAKKKSILDETQDYDKIIKNIITKPNGDFSYVSCAHDMM